jgi:hypothetical protein
VEATGHEAVGMTPSGSSWSDRLEVVGYSDLDGRPGFKLAMQQVGQRFYLYLGHLWHRDIAGLRDDAPSLPNGP